MVREITCSKSRGCPFFTSPDSPFRLHLCRSQVDVMSWWLYFLQVSFKDLVWSVFLAHFQGKEKVLIPYLKFLCCGLTDAAFIQWRHTKHALWGRQWGPSSFTCFVQTSVKTYNFFAHLWDPVHLFPPILPFRGFSSVQLLSLSNSGNPWTAARQASLSITNFWSAPKPMSIEPVMPSNHLIFCRPLLVLPSILEYQGLFEWVSSSYQVAKVLEFQLQHQPFQWTPRTDLL